MLDFRTETFLCAARLLNFTRAAAELNITQPAVTQHIHYLEEYYHTKLFSLRGKKLLLTEQGEHLYQALTTIRNNELRLQNELNTIAKRKKPLSMGATMTVGEFMLPVPLSRLLRSHPDRKIRLSIDNTTKLLNMLREGTLDVAMIEGRFPKEEFDFLIWKQVEFIPVCSSRHHFREEPSIISDLFSETLILRESGSGTREILEFYLKDHDCDVDCFSGIQEITNMNAIRILTEEDCGITFLYESVVRDSIRRGAIRQIPLKDFHIVHNIVFIWRKNSIFSGEYQEIFRELS